VDENVKSITSRCGGWICLLEKDFSDDSGAEYICRRYDFRTAKACPLMSSVWKMMS